MALKFSSDSFSVKQLFSDPFLFNIPSYQRPYAWTPAEASRLLEDLLLAVDEDKACGGNGDGHFLGSVVLLCETNVCSSRGMKNATASERQQFQIIDGQQRLVTVVILLGVLRDIIAENDRGIAQQIQSMFEIPGPADRARLVMNGGEGKFLNKFVLRPGASEDMPACDKLSTAQENMLAVREYFAAELSNMEAGQLPLLLAMVRDDCGFSVVTTRTIDRAFRVFATLNDRGRRLTNSDILKAEILGQISNDQDMVCQTIWEDIRARLGDHFEDLFSHIRMIYGKEKVPVIQGVRAIIAEAGGALAFIDTILQPMAEAFEFVLNKGSGTGASHRAGPAGLEISQTLTRLHWLRESGWIPPAMQWIVRLKNNPDQLARFLNELERFSFCLLIIGLGGRKRQGRYKAILNAKTGDALFDPALSPMTFKREDQRRILYNLRNLYGRDQYACKLVLLLLSEELAGRPERLDRTQLTVEHVLPVNPDRDSNWRSLFSDPDELDQCTVCLGNLILVPADQNRDARNFEFEQKMEIFFQSERAHQNYLQRPCLTEQLRELEEWTPEIVRERERQLTQILRRKWRLNIASNRGAMAAPTQNGDDGELAETAYVI